jgi:hypothetical protein
MDILTYPANHPIIAMVHIPSPALMTYRRQECANTYRHGHVEITVSLFLFIYLIALFARNQKYIHDVPDISVKRKILSQPNIGSDTGVIMSHE